MNRAQRLRRRVDQLFIVTAVLYVLLGVLFTVQAVGQQTLNPVAPDWGKPTLTVPTGSDDKSVQDFFHYMHLRELATQKETYLGAPAVLLTYYGLVGVGLITFYFLTFAWYARLKTGDLYPVEAYNGYISERGGPVDPFNWAVYAILLAYMLYYTVNQIIFGQLY